MRRLLFAVPLLIAASILQPAGAAVTQLNVRLTMSDGVKVAGDIIIPDGLSPDGDAQYPCVVEVTPYRKETRASEGASYLPGAGIVLMEVDARGTGGSEGEYDIVFSVREQADAAEWIEWAATQATHPITGEKLCEETVGMYGGSYSGIIQYLVASLPDTAQGDVPARPQHLAAIAPQRAYGDLYRDIVYHGGQVIGSFGTIWSSGTSAYYLEPPTDVQTADGQAAYLDHLTGNDPMIVPYLASPYADATFTSDDSTPNWTQKLYEDSSILPRIENLTVPTLHLAGWFDSFTRGQLMTFSKAYELEQTLGGRGPNYLVVGPWNHSGTHFISPDQGYKKLLGDWYHCWLEQLASACDALPDERVRYFHMNTGTINAQTAADGTWMDADAWPRFDDIDVERMYLRAGGSLSGTAPGADEGDSTYVFNPSAGKAETLSRWDNAAGTPHPQLDQRLEGPAGLTFQTEVLTTPLSIAGPIGMQLQMATTGAWGDPSMASQWPGVLQQAPPYHDTDIVVKVSDVAPDGSARLVTQGYLRASHRAVDLSRSIVAGGEVLAPYHPHTLASLDPPTDDAVREYLVEIWPVAKTFRVGHRLRIDITAADTPNHLSLLKPAVNTVSHNAGAVSYLSLPVVPTP